MKYLRKFNEGLDNDVKELIYTMEDIFVDLKDMGCRIEIYPNPENDKEDFENLVNYINDKLDFSDPTFVIYIKDGDFFQYKKKANECLNILKRTLEPWGLYVTSAKRELINPYILNSENATIIKISKK